MALSEQEKAALTQQQTVEWLMVKDQREEQQFEGLFANFLDNGRGSPGRITIQFPDASIRYVSEWSFKWPKDFDVQKLIGSYVKFKRKGSKFIFVVIQ